MHTTARSARPPRRDLALLTAVGAAIMLAQYVAVREISSTLFSSELSVSFAVLATLLGPAAGYALADRVRGRALFACAIVALAVHLALPWGARLLVALLSRSVSGSILGTLVLFLLTAFLAGFYAAFLPRTSPSAAELPERYAAELLGAALSLAFIALVPDRRAMLVAHDLAPALVLGLAFGPRAFVPAVLLAALAWSVGRPLEDYAARAFYARRHGHASPTMLDTVYSPYQRIDVVQDARGRSLYLDGVAFYRGGDLAAFDTYLAGLPGEMHPGRGRALVLGSGSFSSAAYLHRLGYRVTVVELDALVAEVGFRDFAREHGLRPGDVEIRIEDGRRFLAESAPHAFDLIVLDVPAPFHLRTAMLHTRAFYQLVRTRLAPGGVASLSLCDDADGPVGRTIAAAAASAFPQVLAVQSDAVGLAVLYAGEALPFDGLALATKLEATDATGGVLWTDRELRAQAALAPRLAVEGHGAAAMLSWMELRDALAAR